MKRVELTSPHRFGRGGRHGTLGPAAVLVLAAGLLTASVQAEERRIYRTVDENGNVVFTDVAPKSNPEEQAVDLGRPNSFSPPESPRQRPGTDPGDYRRELPPWLRNQENPGLGERPDQGPANYASLQVASPAHDAAVRDNAGNVTVVAAVEPELQEGHRLQVYLDGSLRQTSRSTAIQLTNLDRGTHSVELRIVDPSGATLLSSEPSVFHLQRRSVLLQPAGGRSGG